MEVREVTVRAPLDAVAGGDTQGESFQYINLLSGEILESSGDETRRDGSWHIGVKRSIICVNGGGAGAGGMVGACIDPPEESSREDFLNLTDEDWKRKFDSVLAMPAGVEFKPEGIDPAIYGWRFLKDNRWTAPISKGWKLRLSDGASFAKMRIVKVEEDGETVEINYSFQPAKGAPLNPQVFAIIKPGDCFNFKKGKCVSSADVNWDIKHGGDKIYLNGHASGEGKAGAIGSNKFGAKWKSIEDASDSIAYFMDEFGAIFRSPKWYRYNIDGNHNIHPNGAVYGLRSADGDLKAQIFYYDIFQSKGDDVGKVKIRYAWF